MAQQATLRAEARQHTGKGAARALRRAGKIPAVIYGHNRAAEAVQVDAPALGRLLAGLKSASTLLDVTIGSGQPVKALLREIQRDPLRPSDILHLDLYEVRADEKISLNIAVKLVGTPEGVRTHGGVLDQVLYSLEVRCFPGDIPEKIRVEIADLEIGGAIALRDLAPPSGVEFVQDPELRVVSIHQKLEEEAPPALGEAEVAAEPELIQRKKEEAEEEEGGKE